MERETRGHAHHQAGMAWIPACQYVQMFFSDMIGTCCVRDLRILLPVRLSCASTKRSCDLNSSGMANLLPTMVNSPIVSKRTLRSNPSEKSISLVWSNSHCLTPVFISTARPNRQSMYPRKIPDNRGLFSLPLLYEHTKHLTALRIT